MSCSLLLLFQTAYCPVRKKLFTNITQVKETLIGNEVQISPVYIRPQLMKYSLQYWPRLDYSQIPTHHHWPKWWRHLWASKHDRRSLALKSPQLYKIPLASVEYCNTQFLKSWVLEDLLDNCLTCWLASLSSSFLRCFYNILMVVKGKFVSDFW